MRFEIMYMRMHILHSSFDFYIRKLQTLFWNTTLLVYIPSVYSSEKWDDSTLKSKLNVSNFLKILRYIFVDKVLNLNVYLRCVCIYIYVALKYIFLKSVIFSYFHFLHILRQI